MKSLAQIAAELPAHDPHALPAELVHAFVDQLVQQIHAKDDLLE